MRAETELRLSSRFEKQGQVSRLGTGRLQARKPGTGGQAQQQPDGKIRHWRERERPEPTVVWQTLTITFVSFAFGAGVAALTVPGDAVVRPSELWIACAGFILAAALCLAAHRDVNRGRKSKEYEVEEIA